MLITSQEAVNNEVPELEIQKLLDRDPYLTDHKQEIERRFGVFQSFVKDINSQEGGIEQFALGHKKFGAQVNSNNDIVVRYLNNFMCYKLFKYCLVDRMGSSSSESPLDGRI